MKHKNVVMDFDGVIHSDESGWLGADVCPDPVVPGMKEEIARIRENGWKVYVVSSRNVYPEGLKAVKKYLDDNGIVVDDVCVHKPPAMVYLDDRAMNFSGDPTGLLEKVEAFKPWWKKGFVKDDVKGFAEELKNRLSDESKDVVDALLKELGY